MRAHKNTEEQMWAFHFLRKPSSILLHALHVTLSNPSEVRGHMDLPSDILSAFSSCNNPIFSEWVAPLSSLFLSSCTVVFCFLLFFFKKKLFWDTFFTLEKLQLNPERNWGRKIDWTLSILERRHNATLSLFLMKWNWLIFLGPPDIFWRCTSVAAVQRLKNTDVRDETSGRAAAGRWGGRDDGRERVFCPPRVPVAGRLHLFTH